MLGLASLFLALRVPCEVPGIGATAYFFRRDVSYDMAQSAVPVVRVAST